MEQPNVFIHLLRVHRNIFANAFHDHRSCHRHTADAQIACDLNVGLLLLTSSRQAIYFNYRNEYDTHIINQYKTFVCQRMLVQPVYTMPPFSIFNVFFCYLYVGNVLLYCVDFRINSQNSEFEMQLYMTNFAVLSGVRCKHVKTIDYVYL